MFYHVVMMKFKPGTPESFFDECRAITDRMAKTEKGVRDLRWAKNTADRGKGYDHAVMGVYDSSADHDAYQVCDLHVKLKGMVAQYLEDLVVFDTDVPGL
ncbi:MAG: Dabb family protein [Rhodospirillales bacterium]|nr:Dabb family protein [Rhodospirillales bacterium]